MLRPTIVAAPLPEYIVVSEEMTMHPTRPTVERLLTQAYDLEQRGQPLEAARLRLMARETPQTEAPLLSLNDQIAELAPGTLGGSVELGTLPTGETIKRDIYDGVLSKYITVSRGDVSIDIDPQGGFSDVETAHGSINTISPQEAEDLRVLLNLDRAQLAAVADLGPDITEAIDIWFSYPWHEMKPIAQADGFAAWFHNPNRPQVPLPEPEEPLAAPAAEPAPIYELDRTSLEVRTGTLMGRIYVLLCRAMGRTDAERFLTWAESLSDEELARQLAQMHAVATPAPAVRLKPAYRDDDGELTSESVGPLAFHDFIVGDGLTKVLIGPFTDTLGVELIINGCAVGASFVHEPQLTFDQVREIHANLGALLADPRVVAALADR